MSFTKVLTALGLALAASYASANMVQTFSADGTTEGVAQQATAKFDFSDDGALLTLTLTDDVTPTGKIASLLDGFVFTLSETPFTQHLSSVIPGSVISCAGQDPGTTSCPLANGASPYGYGSTQTGSTIELGAGFNNDGTFSYKPFGIVNTSYQTNDEGNGNGGLSNPKHNPLLVGPVQFIFDLTGLSGSQEVTSVRFKFGTVPDEQAGKCTGTCTPPCTTGVECSPSPDPSIPEPQTLALLSLGLLGMGWSLRRTARPR